ncbi:MAG: SCO family protein [Candidatus Marinimicrobia bacterium]|nr:SCO family protein [Candidatus Neomarinimicrobiota bacterium]MCF7829786.1 SCO family protein [Candidatus Neomarinimicrobiota bacterium]MCF7881781.1 SCO family protein [Candidatus Neomarinimicrobiota bacterium]
MSSKRSLPVVFVWGFSIVLILAIVAWVVINQAHRSRADLPSYGDIPQFEFVNQDGDPFGTEEIMGEITVLDFIFTNCEGPCPIMSSKMSQLYTQYSNAEQLQFVSISVDPARDTLEALKAYGKRHGVNDDRWNFLRAPIDSVRKVSMDGFMLGGNFPMGHSTKFVLIDPKGEIRGYYNSLEDASIEALKSDIKVLAERFG